MAEIKVDKNELRNISGTLQECKTSIYDAYTNAHKAEQTVKKICKPNILRLVTKIADGNRNRIDRQIDLLNRMITSFESTDAEIRKEAENILGQENYRKIATGAGIVTTVNSQTVSRSQATSNDLAEIRKVMDTVHGQKQVADQCTSATLVTAIRRDMAARGMDPNSLSYDAFRFATGNKAPECGTYDFGEYSYEVKSVSTPTNEAELAKLLDEYPSGVEIYVDTCKTKNKKDSEHAILISGYTIDENGNYHFSAYDSCNYWEKDNWGNQSSLEKTWLYSSNEIYVSKFQKVCNPSVSQLLKACKRNVRVVERKN